MSQRVTDVRMTRPRHSELFQTPPTRVGRIEEAKIVPEEKKQLNLILNELRKELFRMEHDDWKFPNTEF